MTLNSRPKLRSVDPVPVMVQGTQAIGLKDPLQLAEDMVCVQREALSMLALLDGNHLSEIFKSN